MMNVVELDFKKKIVEDSFKASQGTIEEIYFSLSEHVLVALYKAFPFHSLFEGFSWENRPNEFFKSCVFHWADYFKFREIHCFKKADNAIKKLIDKNVIPSLGMFCSVYFGGEIEMIYAEFEEYLTYLNQNTLFNKEDVTQKIHNAELYNVWREKKKINY